VRSQVHYSVTILTLEESAHVQHSSPHRVTHTKTRTRQWQDHSLK